MKWIDQGTNGLDDDNLNGVDDMGERNGAAVRRAAARHTGQAADLRTGHAEHSRNDRHPQLVP